MTRIIADWLESHPAQSVAALLNTAGHHALFVGGCVRNTLLNEPVADLDLATDAHPPHVLALAEAARIRAIPTGIDHGTVTLVVDAVPVEVTTFRRDVETDGRRAVVAFSTDISEDAQRRDFTMNAIYCDAGGQIVDPLNGLPDLQNRAVRFVGDPTARVREDYLRILRFFRFHAWYGQNGLDQDGLDACARNAGGLAKVSAERIGVEMLKLLAAPNPAPVTAAMAQSGVLAALLPGADPAPLTRLIDLYPHADAVLRLACLGGEDVANRLRLSRADTRRLGLLHDHASGGASPAALGHHLGEVDGLAALALRAAWLEQRVSPGDQAKVEQAARAIFPVTAQDLMPEFQGPALGARLDQLRAAWIGSDFAMSRRDLLTLPQPR
ncbi:CCA tRNA nucleotidyltransferase [Actibacterium sp. 188UL27-1]|uniref:CCA tRNA nucleotidyltransferase n=1 Tax=Actibacterium sp. 188UL27-1 TaxID=2786961 RepID=UPI0019566933|nr:CCA tRNA nucleotidyltransferase [Actibacterium sp. 188UL27-1]MBM7067308.1 CCA tRNA nucleotidyltransferase [Actibacterium sp. 188UL27-1]